MTKDMQGLDLSKGLNALRRHAALAVALTVLGGAAGYALTALQPEQHTATSRVLVGSVEARSYQDALDGTVLSSRLLSSYAGLIDTRPLLRDVQEETRSDLSIEQLKGRLEARAVPNTLLLDVLATDGDAGQARELADAAAAALVSVIEDLDSDVSKIVTADVVDPAAVATPSELREQVAGIFAGALLGLLLAVLIGLVRSARDATIRGPEQAERAVTAPFLATIPRQGSLEGAPVVVSEPASAAAEAFRELRTTLMLGQEPMTTLLVTSPLPGDGKSVVASNLAAAFAMTGQRVVLIDADLRRGRIASRLGLEAEEGLSTLLGSDLPVQAVLQEWSGLEVIPRGLPVGNPSELLGSERMQVILAECRERADVVIIDVPPVIAATDAVVLSAFVDGVLVVVREGVTGAGLAAEAARRLARVGARTHGVVLNDVTEAAARSYYAEGPLSLAPLTPAQPVRG